MSKSHSQIVKEGTARNKLRRQLAFELAKKLKNKQIRWERFINEINRIV